MNLKDVRILLFEPDRNVRSVLRGKLREMGFDTIQEAQTAEAAEKALLTGDVDLALVETRHRGDDMCALMRNIRLGDKSHNPFPVVIATCHNADEAHMQGVIDAGFDSALIKPFDTGTMAKRLRYFREVRKPFVVTHDYVGPDRRAAARTTGQETRMITVPNPVRVMADGLGRDYLDRLVRDARFELDEAKMRKDGDAIKWLVDRLCGAAMAANARAAAQCLLLARQLRTQAESMNRRSIRTSYTQVADLCITIADVATRMVESGGVPTYKDLDLLRNLNQAVGRALQGAAGEEVFAQEIQRSVRPKD